MIRIEDLDVGADLDVAGLGHAGTFLLQHHALHALGMLADRDLLDVEDDVGDILAHAGDRGELVQHAVDMHRGDRRALKRGKQHAAKRIAEGQPETALERLSHDERETLPGRAQTRR